MKGVYRSYSVGERIGDLREANKVVIRDRLPSRLNAAIAIFVCLLIIETLELQLQLFVCLLIAGILELQLCLLV